MTSPCDPRYASAGDVGAALMLIDSQLKGIRDGRTGTDAEQRALVGQLTGGMGPQGVDDVLDGTCTLIFMFMKWLRMAHEAQQKDVVEYVVPNLVASLRMMPASIRAETIPTMAGLLVAAGTGLSPSLWRRQFGDWSRDEMNPLEATALLLAEYINRLTDDPDFATRMISETFADTGDR
ncbi:hypothetical protein [Streptomyces sp. CMB-StM0423]|uniref:hypothetical protein n=1 Tax=Streptomyces sp. CMB-StM0423 TaxID=2059884 RepID=UPI000C700DA5|nr:hypothetical protein [Streptomyces sp. CMB-StM0423]AUH39500.1 hypothetical protein CXR04_03840 [Streptomyces sp. CMB-StM0423]